MSEHYDVIIIGTGAGGGTLAHRLAPVRQAHPAARARRLPAARARELGLRGGLRQRALPSRASAGIDKRRRRVHAARSSTSSAATPSSTAAILFRLRERDFGEVQPLRRRLARVADLATPTSSPTTPRPSGSTSSTAQAGEDPTEPPRSGPFPYPGRLARAAHPAARTTTSRAPATSPFHLPVGVDLDESRPRGRPLRALRPLRRLPLPDRRQGRRARAAACARRSSTPNVTLRTHAQGRAARDRRRRPHGDARSSSTAAATRGAYSADVVVVSCGAVNSAALLLRSASDRHPNGLANSLRQSSAATTWPTSTPA